MEVKRSKTPEQALGLLMNLCAKSERSVSDARRSLYRWGVDAARHDEIVRKLVEQRFIDERRYAGAYVREKLNLSRWGIHKIRAALRAKQIPEAIVEEALAQADEHAMSEKLEAQLRRKMNSTKAPDEYALRGKLLRYGAGLGFDYDDVSDTVDRLLRKP